MGTISWMRDAGPLALFAEGFEEQLRRLGHQPAPCGTTWCWWDSSIGG